MDVKDVKKVAVFGAGTMGPVWHRYSRPRDTSSLYSRKQRRSRRPVGRETNMGTFVEHGLSSGDAVPRACAHQADSVGRGSRRGRGFRDREHRGEGGRQEGRVRGARQDLPDGAIFTSNTSYLNIFELVPERRLPHTIIAHWFAPPHIIPLVEVVKGPETVRRRSTSWWSSSRRSTACPR